MYSTLLILHSITRWLVLGSLLYAIFRAVKGYVSVAPFSKIDNSVRHWTATISHIQLIIGVILYIKSPVIRFYFSNYSEAKTNEEISFFGSIHSTLMFVSVVIVTIGSAMAKRKSSDKEKFKTILLWFGLALIIILIAIPWPFSPFANRPYLRHF
jgi:hypothetical protein